MADLMSEDFKTCAIESCTVVVKRDILMCREHWFMVPQQLRARVWKHWLRGAVSEYLDARAEAIRFVEELLAVVATDEAPEVSR